MMCERKKSRKGNDNGAIEWYRSSLVQKRSMVLNLTLLLQPHICPVGFQCPFSHLRLDLLMQACDSYKLRQGADSKETFGVCCKAQLTHLPPWLFLFQSPEILSFRETNFPQLTQTGCRTKAAVHFHGLQHREPVYAFHVTCSFPLMRWVVEMSCQTWELKLSAADSSLFVNTERVGGEKQVKMYPLYPGS